MKRQLGRGMIVLALGILVGCVTSRHTDSNAKLAAVDFRYSPPEWQTAICLPDDPHKSLVDKSGALLYDFGKGGREFGTRISVEVVSNAVWQKQELLSPRIPVVRTFRTADGLQIVEESFAITAPTTEVRRDAVLVRVTNTGAAPRIITPCLVVNTTLDYRRAAQCVLTNTQATVRTSLKITDHVDGKKPCRRIQLADLTMAPGKAADFAVLYSYGASDDDALATVENLTRAREQAIAFWEQAPLPYERIQIPDAGIQALVDSSIRNIWQAREIKNGMTAFQVGPTCYRGLWIVDGAFLLEAATILGAGDQARAGVAYELTHQKPDGRIEVLKRYWKENGIVLWTCVRHGMLTQDKAWLESIWPQLTKAAAFIHELREQSRHDEFSLDDGLNPPGEIDGGLSGEKTDFKRPEFSNVHWNLLGLRAFAQAAQWLGKTNEAARWQAEYEDFYATFRKATARDTRKAGHGNAYVPIFMANAGDELPQRAQWTFCHAVYPGQIFAKDDPLVAGNMAMLEATEREGMVYGTGWDATGIWNYFASFYAHAWLWQGNGRKAAQILYAYANHAAPVRDWREEQSLKGEKFKKVGDMPHNWASAEFIRLVVHLLALDRGDELHLLEGFPREWAKPGMVTKLNGIATPFGPLQLEVMVAGDGHSAKVKLGELKGRHPAKIVLHFEGLTGQAKTVELPVDRSVDQTFTW